MELFFTGSHLFRGEFLRSICLLLAVRCLIHRSFSNIYLQVQGRLWAQLEYFHRGEETAFETRQRSKHSCKWVWPCVTLSLNRKMGAEVGGLPRGLRSGSVGEVHSLSPLSHFILYVCVCVRACNITGIK